MTTDLRNVIAVLQMVGSKYGASLSGIQNEGSDSLVSFDVVDALTNIQGLDQYLSLMRTTVLSKFGSGVSIKNEGVQSNFMEHGEGKTLKRLWIRVTENTLRPGYWSEALNEDKDDPQQRPHDDFHKALTRSGFAHADTNIRSGLAHHSFEARGKNLHLVLTAHNFISMQPDTYHRYNEQGTHTDTVKIKPDGITHITNRLPVDVDAQKRQRQQQEALQEQSEARRKMMERYENSPAVKNSWTKGRSK
jgi:hypothetical protein